MTTQSQFTKERGKSDGKAPAKERGKVGSPDQVVGGRSQDLCLPGHRTRGAPAQAREPEGLANRPPKLKAKGPPELVAFLCWVLFWYVLCYPICRALSPSFWGDMCARYFGTRFASKIDYRIVSNLPAKLDTQLGNAKEWGNPLERFPLKAGIVDTLGHLFLAPALVLSRF